MAVPQQGGLQGFTCGEDYHSHGPAVAISPLRRRLHVHCLVKRGLEGESSREFAVGLIFFRGVYAVQADLDPVSAADRFYRKGIAIGNGNHASFPGPGRYRQEKEGKDYKDTMHGRLLSLVL